MNCNHRCYECHIPACPERVRQSIGPRIVPMFADPPEWSADKVYSPLTLVIHNGATYMSRRCVPANTALPDTDPFYNESWVMVYDMNAQVAQYREEVAQLSQQVTDFGGKIDNWEQLIVQWTALIQGWQNQFPELAKDLAAITERVAVIETQLDQALEDITALQTTQQTHTKQIAANTQGLADLTPRVAAAETHLSALDDEQQVQDEHLNNLDESQTEQDTRIQAAHDLAVQAKNTADNNTQQITENAGKIAANAAEIAKHAEQLEALKAADTALDGKISQNTAAIAQNTADIAQAKTDIKQAAAAAQQAQDTATHADSTAQAAQELAQQAKDAADAAAGDLSGVTDRVEALETSQGTQDGKISALETSQSTQDGKISALETAQTQTAQDVANLKDGSTELPYVKKVNGNATGTLAVENITVSGTATVGEPVNDTDAASKKYVDQAVQNATGGITPDVSKLKQDVAALQESQTTQDSKISAAAQTAQTAQETAQAAKTTADQAAQDVASIKNGSTALPYIKDTGDTVTGDYDFTGGTLQVAAPTRPADAATKQYVDNAVGQATDPALTARVEALETSQTQQDTEIANLKNGSTALPYVKKTGDSMTGVLNMSNNKVTNVADPSANGDAVNKKYVDDKATETETTLKEYVDEHSGGFENAVIVGLYDMTKTGSIPREANNDYLFITLPTFSNTYYGGMIGTIRNGSNQGANAYQQQIGASTDQFTFTGNGYVMVYRVAVAVTPVPVDPATKFNQIDLSNYVGSLSGSTVNTASDFKAALQYILDNNSGKHFYYGTDHAGTTWYFASDTELSSLSNDSYTCGNGVQNNGTAVKETFVLNKYEDDPAAKFVTVTGLDIYSNGGGTEDQSFDTLNEALEKLGSYSRRYFYKINDKYFATDDEIVNGKTYEVPNELTISGGTIEHDGGYTVYDGTTVSYTGTAHY